jgi:hypothetical protein
MMVYFCVNRKILKKHKKLSNVEVEYIKTVLLLVLVRIISLIMFLNSFKKFINFSNGTDNLKLSL